MKKDIVVSMVWGIVAILILNYIPSLEIVSSCQNLKFVNQLLCEFSVNNGYYCLNYFIIALAISFVLYKVRGLHLKRRMDSIVISSIITLFMVIGKCYTGADSLYVVVSSFYNIIMTIITFIFYFVMFNYFFTWLFWKFENNKKVDNKEENKLITFIFYKHPFLMTSLIIFLISLFYLIVCYPGNVSYDGFWQLDMYYGILEFTDHHPALLTMFMGKLMDLGTYLINDNFGIFLYVFMQIIINALVYGYVLFVMNEMNVNKYIRIFTLLFFISPLCMSYSITYIKDTMFFLILLLMFTYEYFHLYYLKEKKFKNYAVLLLIMLILFFFRNTGFYIVFLNLIFLLILKIIEHSQEFKYILFMLICVFSEKYLYNNVILPNLDIEKGMIAEMMSIPLQQTARYITYYSEDITEEEEEILTNIWNASLDEIASLYDADLSDDIKGIIRLTKGTEELSDYFEVWSAMLIRHPLVYIEATINNYYGYFYIDTLKYTIEDIIPWGVSTVSRINVGNLDIYFNDNTEFLRNGLYYFYHLTSRLPLVSMLYSCSTYTLSLLSIGVYLLFKHKYKLLIYLVPLFAIILICCVSPVNGYIRYLMPLVVSTPMLIAIFSKSVEGE